MTISQRYRETNTGDHYVIRYEKGSDGVWRAFAASHPRNPFDTAVSNCHLYSSKEICVDRSKFPTRTFDKIKACVFLWMDGYSQYVRTGAFRATGGRVSV